VRSERDIPGGGFPTTRWSAVVGARSDDEGERQRSWEALVAAYWRPAYKHVRLRWRKSPEEAEDLVQGFFERAMAKDFFDRYDPSVARFRTFFRTCLDRHTGDEAKAQSRLKRGGGARIASLDFDAAESELAVGGTEASIEDTFDREWRRSVFTLGVEALRQECAAKGKDPCFRAFERYDLRDPTERPTYETLAAELGVSVPTVTNHLAYARRELRRLVLVKLEEITASHEELRDEARALLGVDVG
jgi:RNA polymerase sigma factor (sigma-70 family)